MRKLVGVFTAFIAALVWMTSCMDDSSSTAEQTFAVITDSIEFSNPNDTIYDTLVVKALAELDRSEYTFTEKATSDNSNSLYAIAMCNQQADKTFQTNMKRSVTLSQIQTEMFKAKSDYFTNKGITNASGIGLSPMKLYQSLWNLSSGYLVSRYSFTIDE